jgi:hypothetical protein
VNESDLVMDKSSFSGVDTSTKHPIKSVLTVGNVTLVPLEKSIVNRLGITENNTFFQEEVVNEGILLRMIKDPLNRNE